MVFADKHVASTFKTCINWRPQWKN